MSETPRYRCAAEKGFFSQPTEIAFAKLGFHVGVGQRAELDDEFDFDGVPGKWMDPINEAARERVAELVQGGQRKTMSAPVSEPRTPIKPPKSGMRALTDTEAFEPTRTQIATEAPDARLSNRPAPRRRAGSK